MNNWIHMDELTKRDIKLVCEMFPTEKYVIDMAESLGCVDLSCYIAEHPEEFRYYMTYRKRLIEAIADFKKWAASMNHDTEKRRDIALELDMEASSHFVLMCWAFCAGVDAGYYKGMREEARSHYEEDANELFSDGV